MGDSDESMELLWRSWLVGPRLVHFIFIMLTAAQLHAAKLLVSLKRA